MPSTARSDRGDTYTVTAVRYATLVTERSDLFLNHRDYGEPDRQGVLDYYFWVISNPDRTIVLDTGFDISVGARRGRLVHIDPLEAILALGIADVPSTTVVLSHAHYDHIGNVAHFQRAALVMAAAEYDFWVEKPRSLRLTDQLIEHAELEVLHKAHSEGRLRLIAGDSELAPGVTVLAGHGHTPGQLMVMVRADVGTLLLTSDAVHLDEELVRRMPFRHMTDLAAAVDTYAAIDELVADGIVDTVIAGHQPYLRGHFAADPRLPDHSLILTSALPS